MSNATDTTLLIVDDSDSSLLLLKTILLKAGYPSLVTASSGEQALELLRQRSQVPGEAVDLVLMDINMPGLSGIETLRLIKADPTIEDVPVVMVTGSDDEESLQNAFAAGALDYIGKPVRKIELLARVKSVLLFRQEMNNRILNERGLLELTGSLAEAYKQLEDLNLHLEKRVQERTAELEKAYAELKALDDMKTAFLSNVSHELLSPLTSVLGFASRIRHVLHESLYPHFCDDATVDPNATATRKAMQRVDQNIDIIIAEARRLTTRIRDVLDITQMETGEVQWSKGRVDLAEVIRQAVTAHARAIEEKGLEFKLEIAPDLPIITGDRIRLVQAIGSLLANAVKFTDHGHIACRAVNRGHAVLITVQDTGRGFSASEYESVFAIFRQTGDGLTDKPQGTGLGVPISNHIVQHHGGRLWAQSEPGKGTTFFILLPIR